MKTLDSVLYSGEMSLIVLKMSVAALRYEVRRADAAYRNGQPLMTDEAFDLLVEQLRKRAPHAPELQAPFGGTALLSLNKYCFADWHENVGGIARMVVQPKIDGAAIAIRYVKGKLDAAWTRSGRSAMPIIESLPSVPKKIGSRRESDKGVVEVHGELYAVDQSRSQQLAAASLRQKKPNAEGLLFSAYKLMGATGTEVSTMGDLQALGFDVPDTLLCTKAVEVQQLHAKWLRGEVFASWPTDGIVVKVLDHKLQQKLGADSVAPNWALALKKNAEF